MAQGFSRIGGQGFVRIEGINAARANLRRLQATIPGRARDGLDAGAEVARRAAVTRTPIEEGGLRAGFRITGETYKSNARVVLANVEEYAAYVHEQTAEKLRGQKRPGGRRGHYWDGGESKFLEKGVYHNVEDIVDAIQRASHFERVG